MSLDRLYQQLILDHNRAPRNRGSLPGATHSARGLDALCGDDILLELIVESGQIRQAAFSGQACAITTASASLLTDWLEGREVARFETDFAEFRRIMSDPAQPDVADFGDLNQLRAVSAFPARVRNALLPWQAVGRALNVSAMG